jgi:hypothetical protein
MPHSKLIADLEDLGYTATHDEEAGIVRLVGHGQDVQLPLTEEGDAALAQYVELHEVRLNPPEVQ